MQKTHTATQTGSDTRENSNAVTHTMDTCDANAPARPKTDSLILLETALESTVNSSAASLNNNYTRSEDGHLVGSDGFVVPTDFPEFHSRFPQLIRKFVRKLMSRASEAEHEDRESELNVFLMSVPVDSKFREPGFNGLPNGCNDRIQIFSPEAVGGATRAHFFGYLYEILTNHFCTLATKAPSNPIRRYNTLSLYSPDGDGNIVDDDYIYLLTSDRSARDGMDYDAVISTGIFVKEFLTFVERYNPELIAVAEAIGFSDTYVDATAKLGMTEKLFQRARNRLEVLHAHFDAGTEPPRQRKVYRPRVPAKVLTLIPATTVEVTVETAEARTVQSVSVSVKFPHAV